MFFIERARAGLSFCRGHLCLEARGGSAEALLSASRMLCPSCLILDVNLPGLSGLDLRQMIARDQVSLPVIFMNKQVAVEVGISEITIKAHQGRVMQKMNADSSAELVNFAAALGIAKQRVSWPKLAPAANACTANAGSLSHAMRGNWHRPRRCRTAEFEAGGIAQAGA